MQVAFERVSDSELERAIAREMLMRGDWLQADERYGGTDAIRYATALMHVVPLLNVPGVERLPIWALRVGAPVYVALTPNIVLRVINGAYWVGDEQGGLIMALTGNRAFPVDSMLFGAAQNLYHMHPNTERRGDALWDELRILLASAYRLHEQMATWVSTLEREANAWASSTPVRRFVRFATGMGLLRATQVIAESDMPIGVGEAIERVARSGSTAHVQLSLPNVMGSRTVVLLSGKYGLECIGVDDIPDEAVERYVWHAEPRHRQSGVWYLRNLANGQTNPFYAITPLTDEGLRRLLREATRLVVRTYRATREANLLSEWRRLVECAGRINKALERVARYIPRPNAWVPWSNTGELYRGGPERGYDWSASVYSPTHVLASLMYLVAIGVYGWCHDGFKGDVGRGFALGEIGALRANGRVYVVGELPSSMTYEAFARAVGEALQGYLDPVGEAVKFLEDAAACVEAIAAERGIQARRARWWKRYALPAT